MGDNNLETRVAILETDVKYLKDGHAEMKTILKGLEGLPYEIRGVSMKLDTLIEHERETKKQVKEEIKELEDRIDCLEDEPKSAPSKILGFDFDKAVKIAYGIVAVCIAIVIMYSLITGQSIPVIGGK